MPVTNPTRCSNCGSNSLRYLNPSQGTAYVLTTVDENKTPPEFNPSNGAPVQLFGCLECGVATLQIKALVR